MKLEDSKNKLGKWRQTSPVAGEHHFTVGGSYWAGMTQRCKAGSSAQRNKPTYVGCTHTWPSCHEFIEWARQQVGYGTGALDKDILLKGNKVYCPELCVFVPLAVNNLLVKCDAARGEFPIGVSWHKASGKFRARLKIDAKEKCLGLFLTPQAAFAAYKQAKEAEARRVAALYRSVLDPRVYDALTSYVVDIDD